MVTGWQKVSRCGMRDESQWIQNHLQHKRIQCNIYQWLLAGKRSAGVAWEVNLSEYRTACNMNMYNTYQWWLAVKRSADVAREVNLSEYRTTCNMNIYIIYISGDWLSKGQQVWHEMVNLSYHPSQNVSPEVQNKYISPNPPNLKRTRVCIAHQQIKKLPLCLAGFFLRLKEAAKRFLETNHSFHLTHNWNIMNKER